MVIYARNSISYHIYLVFSDVFTNILCIFINFIAPGGSFGRASEAIDGGVEIKHRFPSGDLHGTMVERFYCPQPNELRVDTFLEVPARGPGISYRQIYRK